VYGPVPTVVWQGSAGNRRPNADQITMAPSINRSSQLREPSTARAVSVPLALHCMALAALGFEFHARKNNVRDKDEKVWLYLWLYVAKYRDRFKHFEEFSVRARLV
jgi:hypothetical protein